MKVIEMGTKITSDYFGNGYVVRTVIDTNTNQLYVVIRKEVDNDLIFCKYPHAVNCLFLLPPEFSQHLTTAAYIMEWPDAFYDPYYPNHKYERVQLSWQEHVKRSPIKPCPTSPHKLDSDLITTKPLNAWEKEFISPSKEVKTPNRSDAECSHAPQSNVAQPEPVKLEPINKPLLSLDAFAQMKYELYIPDKRPAVPPEELSTICDKDAPPPSYDPWDMWAESLDRD